MATKKITASGSTGVLFDVTVIDEATGQVLDDTDGIFRAEALAVDKRMAVPEHLVSNGFTSDIQGFFEKSESRAVWPDGNKTLLFRIVSNDDVHASSRMRTEDDIEVPLDIMAGIYKVTLQIYETATVVPIADVLIDVYDSTNTSHMNGSRITTSSNGQAEFYRDNGTYKIRMMKGGVTFALGTVTVASADVSATLYGTPITIAAPSTGDACRVYEYCFLPDDTTPMASVIAKARIKSLPYDYNGKYHSGQEIDGTYSAVTGVVYWDLVYGALVEFNIKHIHHGWTVGKTIPTTGTVRLKEIA